MNRKEYGHKIHFGIIWLTAVSMPWPVAITSTAVALLGLSWLLNCSAKEKIAKLKRNWIVWLFVGLYLLYVVGLLYSEQTTRGLFVIEKLIPLILIPLAIGGYRKLSNDEINYVQFGFVASCLLASLLCIAYASTGFIAGSDSLTAANFDYFTQSAYLRNNPDAGELWQFVSYIHLGKPFSLHPTYFSLYLLVCIIILITNDRIRTTLKLVLIPCLSIIIILLSSRIAIVSLALIGLVLIVTLFKGTPARAALASAGFLVLVIGCTLVNPVTRFRLWQEPFEKSTMGNSATNWNSVSIRLLQWNAGLSVLENNWPAGTGTGDVTMVMDKHLKNHPSGRWPNSTANAHNQFLQTGAELGMIGLIGLMACITLPFWYGLKKGNHALLLFLTVFTLSCMTESMLERQKGIVCFSFFTSFFLFSFPKARPLSWK